MRAVMQESGRYDHRTPRVLIIDEGRGFGGSVVVASTLMRHLPTGRYKPILVTAAEVGFALQRTGSHNLVVYSRAAFGYPDAQLLRAAVQWIRPKALGRIVNSALATLGLFANVPHMVRIARLLRQHDVKLIHCNNFDNLEGLLLARLTGTPCVMHAHGLVGPPGPIGRWLRQHLRCQSVAISKIVAKSVGEHKLPGERVSVLYNPVEIPDEPRSESVRTRFRRDYGIPVTAILAGIVGRIIPWKGQKEFVAACLRVMPHYDDLHVLIVGDAADYGSDYRNEIERIINESRHANRFHFVGFLNDPSAAYQAMDLLVHASIEPEPFGLVITEAMAHGVPVIAAASGAPAEWIVHGETAMLCDPTDTGALAKSIEQLVSSEPLRTAIGARGRRYALEAFDASRYASRFADVYDAVLEAHASIDHPRVDSVT